MIRVLLVVAIAALAVSQSYGDTVPIKSGTPSRMRTPIAPPANPAIPDQVSIERVLADPEYTCSGDQYAGCCVSKSGSKIIWGSFADADCPAPDQ